MTVNALARNLPFSNHVIRVVTRDARLARRAKLLACVIASTDGAAVPSIGRICGFSPKTLIAARRELEERGYLETTKVSGRIVSYRLHLPVEASA